uniref:Uncharacterized protein n=1 Tax=Geospiza parvula TaxID=87175 RepID=A0A8U8BQF4_GEOPR
MSTSLRQMKETPDHLLHPADLKIPLQNSYRTLKPLKGEVTCLINLKNISNCTQHKPMAEAALLCRTAVPFWGSMHGHPGLALLSEEIFGSAAAGGRPCPRVAGAVRGHQVYPISLETTGLPRL